MIGGKNNQQQKPSKNSISNAPTAVVEKSLLPSYTAASLEFPNLLQLHGHLENLIPSQRTVVSLVVFPNSDQVTVLQGLPDGAHDR